VRVDRRRGDDLAGLIDDRHFHAGANAGIETHGGAWARRRREQQILQVAREDADGFSVGAFLEARQQARLKRPRQLVLPGDAHGLAEPGIRRAAAIGDAEGGLDAPLCRVWLAGLVRHVEIEVENAFVHTAQHGERAMRWHVLDALAELEVVGELGALVGLALLHGRLQLALAPQPFAQAADDGRCLGDALDEDVARAVQRRLDIGDALAGVDELGGFRLRVERRVAQQRFAQRLEAGLARDLRLRAPLRLVRRVEVFQLDLGRRPVDGACQLGRQLALLVDGLEDSRAAILELAQVGKPLLQLAQLRVVEAAGLLLAVARDERDRRSLAEQLDGRRHLPGGDAQLRRDALVDLVHAAPMRDVSLSWAGVILRSFPGGKRPLTLGDTNQVWNWEDEICVVCWQP
jgi:hypothetical protein